MRIDLKKFQFLGILAAGLVIIIVSFVLGKQFAGDIKFRQRIASDTENQTKSIETKIDLEGKDIRLKSFELEGSVITMLIDYTPPQRNVVKSWIGKTSINPKKIFLSANKRYLVFEFADISVYDFEEKVLVNSLNSRIPQIEGTNVIRLEDNSIMLGLFEGRGGICDENAFSVDLDSFTVKQLQPRSAMKYCSP